MPELGHLSVIPRGWESVERRSQDVLPGRLARPGGIKLVDTGCVSSQAKSTFRSGPPLPRKPRFWFSEWVSEREGHSGRWGSRRKRRRRAAGRRLGVARLVLQTPGRQGRGPGRLGWGRPVASWRIFQATGDPDSVQQMFLQLLLLCAGPQCSLQELR